MKRRWNRVMDYDANRVVDSSAFAVSLARFQAAPKAKAKVPKIKAKLNTVEFAVRFAAEKARQQRRYCDAFALWRTCRNKNCRRQGACCGDTNACLKQAILHVPHDMQWRVRQAILDATPHNIGAPERKARQCMPLDLHEEGTEVKGERAPGRSANVC